MSRQNRNSERERKSSELKRDTAGSNGRDSRNEREPRNDPDRNDISHINGLNKYRLNDLYERSSI